MLALSLGDRDRLLYQSGSILRDWAMYHQGDFPQSLKISLSPDIVGAHNEDARPHFLCIRKFLEGNVWVEPSPSYLCDLGAAVFLQDAPDPFKHYPKGFVLKPTDRGPDGTQLLTEFWCPDKPWRSHHRGCSTITRIQERLKIIKERRRTNDFVVQPFVRLPIREDGMFECLDVFYSRMEGRRYQPINICSAWCTSFRFPPEKTTWKAVQLISG